MLVVGEPEPTRKNERKFDWPFTQAGTQRVVYEKFVGSFSGKKSLGLAVGAEKRETDRSDNRPLALAPGRVKEIAPEIAKTRATIPTLGGIIGSRLNME